MQSLEYDARLYRFEETQRWVNNENILISEPTTPLKKYYDDDKLC